MSAHPNLLASAIALLPPSHDWPNSWADAQEQGSEKFTAEACPECDISSVYFTATLACVRCSNPFVPDFSTVAPSYSAAVHGWPGYRTGARRYIGPPCPDCEEHARSSVARKSLSGVSLDATAATAPTSGEPRELRRSDAKRRASTIYQTDSQECDACFHRRAMQAHEQKAQDQRRRDDAERSRKRRASWATRKRQEHV